MYSHLNYLIAGERIAGLHRAAAHERLARSIPRADANRMSNVRLALAKALHRRRIAPAASLHAPRPIRVESGITWFAQECVSNGMPLEDYIRATERSGDSEMAEFFRRAQRENREVRGRAGR